MNTNTALELRDLAFVCGGSVKLLTETPIGYIFDRLAWPAFRDFIEACQIADEERPCTDEHWISTVLEILPVLKEV